MFKDYSKYFAIKRRVLPRHTCRRSSSRSCGGSRGDQPNIGHALWNAQGYPDTGSAALENNTALENIYVVCLRKRGAT